MDMVRLIAAMLTFAALPAFAADAHFDRTLKVSHGVSLNVTTGSGYIHVTPGSDDQIHISAQVHGNNGWMGGGDLERRVQEIAANPPIRQDGNAVTLGDSNHSSQFQNIAIDYEIQAPRTTVLHASTGSGDVQVEETGGGDSITTGSGSIRMNRLHGGALLKSGSGDIQLQQESAGDVKAETGSGSIRINGFGGGLYARTGSGDIQVEGHVSGDWHLGTGSGSIRLGVGHDAHFTVDADTGSGVVRVSQPMAMQGSGSRHHVHGTVNGGGHIISATTGSGDVEIH